MKVNVRKRLTGVERSALYLDIVQNGKRIKESLNLFLYNTPKNKTEQFENKKTEELAKRLCAERLIALQDNQYGVNRQDFGNMNFIEYFLQKTEDRKEKQGNYGNWDSVYKHLVKCFGKVLRMSDMNERICNQFKEFLEKEARTKSDYPLSQNSKYSYLNKFRACLKMAYKEKILKENLSDFMTGFKQGETEREYLTFEEVQKLAETECRYPILKKAFLFGCLTGLRWSDINRITWQQLRYSDKRGYELCYRQQKTKGMEYLPISPQAVELLGERQEPNDRIFRGLKYSDYVNAALTVWVAKAGIDKKITFHCSRHTHAVLLLENGSDIYTVSKMLGHREIKTTQIYAKIVDSKKVEAAMSIPKLNF
ncbi:MAG: site-specific integrase [Bacteroidia bacterium]